MLGFMDYVQNAFLESTGWDKDNSYGALTATAQNIIDFTTPRSLRLSLSALSTPSFASSYSVGSIGALEGSIAYLYSSHDLAHVTSSSRRADLRAFAPGYRQLRGLRQPDRAAWWETWQQGTRVDRRDALLYGRLYMPQSTLEALYMRRVGPTTQVKIACVSDPILPNGGSSLAHIQHDTSKYCTEYLCSTDSALLGFRGLWNFGSNFASGRSLTADRTKAEVADVSAYGASTKAETSNFQGQFSAGGELYYGLLNKSGGASLGLRFATLLSHPGFPYTMTLTFNPLMGSLSSTYSVKASSNLAMSSRFNFNVYSYESQLQVGTELWRKRGKQDHGDLEWARRKMGTNAASQSAKDLLHYPLSGCLRTRLDQQGTLAVVWEGRIKELLYSCGLNVDLKGGENMFQGFGLELLYSP